MKISLILTFNSGRDNIDKAILRKGRLSYEYEFNKLSMEDAQALGNKIGYKHQVTEPTSIADIYNLENDTNLKVEEKLVIGFAAA